VYFAIFGKPEDVGVDGGSPVSRPLYTRAQHAECSLPQEIEMRSTVNASTLICGAGTGFKRAASKATSAEQSSSKRQHISRQEPLIPTQPSLSNWAENWPSAEAETEFATQGEIAMGAVEIVEETLFVKEIPTAAKGGERHCDEECELDDRANADGSATGDETRSDAQIFKDAVSYQILDDDNSSIDSI
jgi:hypothetical protein